MIDPLRWHSTLADLSAASYLPPREAEEAARTLGFKAEMLTAVGTEALVAQGGGAIVVAFRGTTPSSLRDLLDDADIKFVPYRWGRIHAGFAKCRQRLQIRLFDAIARFSEGKTLPLWATGHSKGAAEATVLMASLVDENPARNQSLGGLVTFGSPRVGDLAFTSRLGSLLEGRIYRYVNNNDAVTRVAYRALGYEHVGEVHYFNHAGKLLTGLEALDGWALFLDRAKGRLEALNETGCDGLRDHSIGRYQSLLRAAGGFVVEPWEVSGGS